MNSCPEVQVVLERRAHGLEDGLAPWVEEHVAGCTECRGYVLLLAQARAALAGSPGARANHRASARP